MTGASGHTQVVSNYEQKDGCERRPLLFQSFTTDALFVLVFCLYWPFAGKCFFFGNLIEFSNDGF